MFGRKSAAESQPTPDQVEAPAGKGKPTPSRKEAEAARLAKVRPPKNRKEQAARDRALRDEQLSKRREALKTGDERYLPARDRGPVRRFVRDWIDSRFLISELLLPVLLVSLIIGLMAGRSTLAGLANMLMMVVLLMAVLNIAMMIFRLRKELDRRFPDDPARGTTWYAVSRALQMRLLRQPKPMVKIGDPLPEIYR